MALVTLGDLFDIHQKLRTRGWSYLSSKLRLRRADRVRATYREREAANTASFWWDPPEVARRINRLVSGDERVGYAEHLHRRHLLGRSVRVLSLGCGRGGNEMLFAGLPSVEHVTGIDLVGPCIEEARRTARERGLHNVEFLEADMERWEPVERYDIVLFAMSLHHFRPLETLLGELVPRWLAPGGMLVVNEFVGPTRWQWTRTQMTRVNQLLASLPPSLRRRVGTGSLKKRVHRPGLLRMLVNDPSESVRSGDIVPLLHELYDVVEERPYGGNLLALLLTDIAHHFVGDDPEARAHLHRLFDDEDRFLDDHDGGSDHVFGVYRPKSAAPALPVSRRAA